MFVRRAVFARRECEDAVQFVFNVSGSVSWAAISGGVNAIVLVVNRLQAVVKLAVHQNLYESLLESQPG